MRLKFGICFCFVLSFTVPFFAQHLEIMPPDDLWLSGEAVELKVVFTNKKGHKFYFYHTGNLDDRYISPKKLDIGVSFGHVFSVNKWYPNIDNFNFSDSITIRVDYLRANVTYSDKIVLKIPKIRKFKTELDTHFMKIPQQPVFKTAHIQFTEDGDELRLSDQNKLGLMNKLVNIKSNLKIRYNKATGNYYFELNKYEPWFVAEYYEKSTGMLLAKDSWPVNFSYDLYYNAEGSKGRPGSNGGHGGNGGTCENGGDGGHGGRGEDGAQGEDLKITIERYNETSTVSKIKIFSKNGEARIFYVDLSKGGRIKISTNGGTGGQGGEGGDGGSGGSSYSGNNGSCEGGTRGIGGEGGDGGDGGNGGNVEIYIDEFCKKYTLNIAVVSLGGVGGAAGSGGYGRRNGDAGSAGNKGSDGQSVKFYPYESFTGW